MESLLAYLSPAFRSWMIDVVRALRGASYRMNHQHGERGEGVTADDQEVDAARPDKGHQHSRHPRCDDPVQIHPRSVQRNGIRQLVLAHQLWDQALPTGHVECEDRPSQHRRHYHVPDLHQVGDDKHRDQKGDYGVAGLGDHQ